MWRTRLRVLSRHVTHHHHRHRRPSVTCNLARSYDPAWSHTGKKATRSHGFGRTTEDSVRRSSPHHTHDCKNLWTSSTVVCSSVYRQLYFCSTSAVRLQIIRNRYRHVLIWSRCRCHLYHLRLSIVYGCRAFWPCPALTSQLCSSTNTLR